MQTREVDDLTERTLSQGYVVVISVAPPNRNRFYRLTVLPTLWGGHNLVREWGRRPGGVRVRQRLEHHDGAAPLRASIRRHLTRRLRHGYRVPDPPAGGGCTNPVAGV